MDNIGMATGVISALFNQSPAALRTAKQVFKMMNMLHKDEIGQVVSDLCQIVASDRHNRIALPKGTEHVTGALLANGICKHKSKTSSQPLLGMKAKYKPVDK
jgi:hypothetical protein